MLLQELLEAIASQPVGDLEEDNYGPPRYRPTIQQALCLTKLVRFSGISELARRSSKWWSDILFIFRLLSSLRGLSIIVWAFFTNVVQPIYIRCAMSII